MRCLSAIVVPLLLCCTIPLAVAETVHYNYDTMHRLTQVYNETHDTAVNRVFDALGNRLTQTITSGQPSNNPPLVPTDFSPADNIDDINSSGIVLEWTGSDPDTEDKVVYDIYLGKSSPPTLYTSGLTTSTLPLLPLESASTYFWKIVAKDNFNAVTSGPELQFTTGNNPPTVPAPIVPEDNNYILYEDVWLKWEASTDGDPLDTVRYDVYFGTETDPELFRSGVSTTSLKLGPLTPDTVYYWKVVAKDNHGEPSATPTRTFTTIAADHILSSISLSQDKILSPGSGPYIIRGTLTVPEGLTLTIHPETILKFDTNAAISVYGALNAVGSDTGKIVFTSIHNDSYGGDSNSNGNLSSPAPGNWYGIRFYDTSDDATTVLEHCIIEYAGYTSSYGSLYTNQASPTIKDTTIRYSNSYGIYVYSGSPTIEKATIHDNNNYGVYIHSGSPTIRNSLIKDNSSWGIYAAGGSATISGNTINGPSPLLVPVNVLGNTTISADNVLSDGGYINVQGGTITQDATWPALQFKITGHVTIKGTDGDDGITTLTLTPGAKLLFGQNIYFHVGGNSGNPGALVAKGLPEKQIIFTSNQETPSAGYWSGIRFYDTSDDATSIMEHCIVEYTGARGYGGTYGGIYIYKSSPTIRNCTIRHSSNYGVYIHSGAPLINLCIITNTNSYGIYNASQTTISAENNWWGHSSGPLDNSDDTATAGLYNPDGQGMSVTNYVDYYPWLTVSNDVDSDGDGISDNAERLIYGTNPNITDSDNDGIEDGAELSYWGVNWNMDYDNDGVINLLDVDSDNDGISDGDEINQGSDPSEEEEIPATILYEDAEDGLTTGWTIYDDDPTGSFVDNVFDFDKDDRVIELYGDGLLNGFALFDEQAQDWDNTNHEVIEWSMKYSEDFVISIAVNTTGGLRYLSYTPEEGDALGTGTDIFHGLKSGSKDGNWHTYIFDLGYHLEEAQPGNSLVSLLGFYVSGNGRVDDIKTHLSIPSALDSDIDAIADNDEIYVYGTHPYSADTDDDQSTDGVELQYWGTDWDKDPDSDGLINLVDPDSDNDGYVDGIEILQATDPADAASHP